MTYSHGTGWAGIPRYIARERLQERINGRALKIEALRAEVEVRPSADLEDALETLRERQDDDLETLTALSCDEIAPALYDKAPARKLGSAS